MITRSGRKSRAPLKYEPIEVPDDDFSDNEDACSEDSDTCSDASDTIDGFKLGRLEFYEKDDFVISDSEEYKIGRAHV